MQSIAIRSPDFHVPELLTAIFIMLLCGPCRAQVARAKHPVATGKNVTGKHAGKFPFNNAKKILLISFENPNTDPYFVDSTGKLQKVANNSGLPDTLGYKQVHEVVLLSAEGTKRLVHTLYKLECTSHTEYGCYNPRNAILFRDDSDKTFAQLEVCFECQVYYTRPEKFHINLSDCAYEPLKAIFANAGIKYGISE